MPRQQLLQFRQGTAAAWVTANPILSAGEEGFETDTGRTKLGDGSTAWTSLGYSALKPSLNLSDVVDAGSSRANLRDPVLGDAQTASSGNVNIASPGATISGYAFVTSGSDQVLLFGQSTGSQNGL